MKMISVSSSAIKAIGYDITTNQMRIVFIQGEIYDYCGVPESVFSAFLNASSVGSFYHSKIKDKYDCF